MPADSNHGVKLLETDAASPMQAGGGVGVSSTIVADDNAAIAMGAGLARTTYGVDGSGIKIGILSDSFNLKGGEAADIAAGNLPAVGSITIKKEGPAGGHDEGRAMAQLIHQVAPGAQIEFYSGFWSEADFAAGIRALAADGCQIIVDDITYFDEPFYQDGGAIQAAVEQVIGQGVSYFTSASNEADDFYEHTWIGLTTMLPSVDSGNDVQAFDFGAAAGEASSPYLDITINPGGIANLDLQWDQPFATIGSGNAPEDSLEIYLYVDGILFTSSTSDPTGNGNPFRFIGVTNIGTDAATVQIAVVDADGGTAPGLFKIINENNQGATGATFDSVDANIGSGTVIGHELVLDANTVGAVDYHKAPPHVPVPVLERFSSVGPGMFLFDSNGDRLAAPISADKVDFTAPDGSSTSVFHPFHGTSAAAPNAAAVAALMLQANPGLTPAQITADLEATALAMSGGTAAVGAGLIQAAPAVQLAQEQGSTACYVAGTRIRTPEGSVPIEQLRIGDDVMTMSGVQQVRWIGWRRIDLDFHPRPDLARPIRIRRGAFAENLPEHDLLVSPEHAVFVDGVLVPARLLVNDGSIAQDLTPGPVHYYHIEFDRHTVVYAEGLPAESYLDTGNRGMFANGGVVIALHPDFAGPDAAGAWQRNACAPLAGDEEVRPIRQRLAERSRRIGLVPPGNDPDNDIVWPASEDLNRNVT